MARPFRLIPALAFTTALISLPLTAGAQTVPTSAHSLQQETTLNLTGNGSVAKAPDIATISVGVQVDSETAAAAMKMQADRMNSVFKALKDANIDMKDMQTGNISLNPQYNYTSRGEMPPRLIGYQASNTLNITVRDLDALGKTLDAVVKAGGNTINSVSFSLDEDTQAVKEARQSAVKDALEKAELYASAAGYKVLRIVSIDELTSRGIMPEMKMMQLREAPSSSSPTPIAAGEVTYTAQVNVQFELGKK